MFIRQITCRAAGYLGGPQAIRGRPMERKIPLPALTEAWRERRARGPWGGGRAPSGSGLCGGERQSTGLVPVDVQSAEGAGTRLGPLESGWSSSMNQCLSPPERPVNAGGLSLGGEGGPSGWSRGWEQPFPPAGPGVGPLLGLLRGGGEFLFPASHLPHPPPITPGFSG